MNYDFIFELSTSMEEQIEKIVETCDRLDAEKSLKFHKFGAKRDLNLRILKEGEYDFKDNHLCSTFFTIYTEQNGKRVDDTSDTYITDDTLWKQLERIWNYKDFNRL